MSRPSRPNKSAPQTTSPTARCRRKPFLGSGTTLIAAETTGRICHAVELDRAYVDVAVQRWQAFTGKEAVHDDSGQTFNEALRVGKDEVTA